MLKKAGKRLLILLPAVWLLASAVFLLSKSIPGSATEIEFEQAMQDANSSAKAEARQRAYRQMRHRTGEDLPLFYFRIGSAAEPDSLHKIYPDKDRDALKKMVLWYGNWPQVSAYYLQVQGFRQSALQEAGSSAARRNILAAAEKLLQQTNADEMQETLQNLKKTLCISGRKVTCLQVEKLQKQFENLQKNPAAEQRYLPKVFWFGTQNQYHRWFKNLLRGELGLSGRDMRPVTQVIGEALRLTLWLASLAFVVVAVSGPAIAMVLSRKSINTVRKLVLNFLYVLESIPLFIMALAVLALAGYWGWLRDFPEETGLLLAAAVLAIVNLPYFTSQAYAGLQTQLRENYIITARAKGVSEKNVLYRHAFRNSLLPLITLLADFFPALLAGTVVLEVIFSLPGMGRLLVNSVLTRDYHVIAGLVLLTGLLKMLAHLLSDLFYNFADPRLRS